MLNTRVRISVSLFLKDDNFNTRLVAVENHSRFALVLAVFFSVFIHLVVGRCRRMDKLTQANGKILEQMKNRDNHSVFIITLSATKTTTPTTARTTTQKKKNETERMKHFAATKKRVLWRSFAEAHIYIKITAITMAGSEKKTRGKSLFVK